MSMNDPIADMLSRFRNAAAVGRREVTLPHSKVKEMVARILVENGFLSEVKVDDGFPGKIMTVVINEEGENPKISEVTRLSKPGRRLYAGSDKLPTVKRGRGILIVSTSQGMMTDKQARSKHLGGELICRVY